MSRSLEGFFEQQRNLVEEKREQRQKEEADFHAQRDALEEGRNSFELVYDKDLLEADAFEKRKADLKAYIARREKENANRIQISAPKGKLNASGPNYPIDQEREASRKEIESVPRPEGGAAVPRSIARRAERVGLRPGRDANSENLVAQDLDTIGGMGQRFNTNRLPRAGVNTAQGKQVTNEREGVIIQKALERAKDIASGALQQRGHDISSQPAQPVQNAEESRVATGSNWAELATAAYFHDNNTRTKEHITDLARNLNVPAIGIEPFLRNLNIRDGGLVNTFLENLHSANSEHGFNPNPEDVYLRGESQRDNMRNAHPDIREAIENLTAAERRRNDKADVMFKDQDGSFKGISVKEATESGQEYHVDTDNIEGPLIEIASEHGLDHLAQRLLESKRELYEGENLPHDLGDQQQWFRDNYPDAIRRNQAGRERWGGGLPEEYANLFRNLNNPFYQNLERLLTHSGVGADYASRVLNSIYPDDSWPYQMFKYNGQEMKKQHIDEIDTNNKHIKRIGPHGRRAQSNAAGDSYGFFTGDNDSPLLRARTQQVMPWGSIRFITSLWNDNDILRNAPTRE